MATPTGPRSASQLSFAESLDGRVISRPPDLFLFNTHASSWQSAFTPTIGDPEIADQPRRVRGAGMGKRTGESAYPAVSRQCRSIQPSLRAVDDPDCLVLLHSSLVMGTHKPFRSIERLVMIASHQEKGCIQRLATRGVNN
jgi:hypothetical protein